MARRPVDEQLLIDFLLGNLPEDETERLDELSFTDEDFAARLQAVENDLVDAYVRNELSGTDLAQFKSNYLQSSKGQEKIGFAETLQKLPNRSSIKPEQQASYPSRWLAAAAILILLTAGYLIFENMRLHNQIEKMQAEKESFQQRQQELQKELGQLQHQSSDTKQRDVKLMAFVLLPQTRGINKIPLIPFPADIDFVALTLKIETNDFTDYVAVLKDPATGKTIWKSGNLQVENSSVEVRVPATTFKSQNYLIELTGISKSGTSEIVSSYPFRIATE